MKKAHLSLFLAFLMIISIAMPACNNSQTGNITEENTMKIMQKSDPAQDDTLYILMIGSSFCYYYVEELWGMLNTAGIPAVVCNVYYSGCPLEKHWSWWKSGEANYQYFTTDKKGRFKTEGVNLEYCLKQHNWDIISLQESTSKTVNDGAETHLEKSRIWRTELMDYIKQQFPQSRHLWHQPWTYQIGYDRNDYKMLSLEQQETNTQIIKEYCVAVCKEQDLERVNTGEAWQIVRQGGYDNLCARLAVGGGIGDYYHDGDIGGGQYLNACVWFEAITGQSCIGNTYRPVTYSLAEELISQLQNAAHQAISNRNSESDQ